MLQNPERGLQLLWQQSQNCINFSENRLTEKKEELKGKDELNQVKRIQILFWVERNAFSTKLSEIKDW